MADGDSKTTVATLGLEVKHLAEIMENGFAAVNRRLDERQADWLAFCTKSEVDRKELHERAETNARDIVRLQEQQGTLGRWAAVLGTISPALAAGLTWLATKLIR